MALTHAYAPQQSACADDKAQFYSELDIAMTNSSGADLIVMTMDTNCAIGSLKKDATPQEELASTCGKYGEIHVNCAGRVLNNWLASHTSSMYAASTHFRHSQRRTEGYGTWRHPRSLKLYQNDHVFIQRSMLNRIIHCRSQAPLCQSDHLSVKATIRVQIKLAKKQRLY